MKRLSAVLALVYFLSNCLLAHALETNVLPPLKIHRGTVIHIQDIHQNEEAQRNISAALESFIRDRGIQTVALEGAFDAIDVSAYRLPSAASAVKTVANYLLKSGRISGPVYSALTFPQATPALIGIDDKKLYRANVQAYRDSTAQLTAVRDYVNHQHQKLSQEKARLFTIELKTFDRVVESYRSRNIGPAAFSGAAALIVSDLKDFPAVKTFLETHRLERSLDFQAVDRQRRRLMEQLAQQLPPPQVAELMASAHRYRAGLLTHTAFYENLQRLCHRARLSLKDTPAVEAYIRYAQLSDAVRGEALSTELPLLEQAAYHRLSLTLDHEKLVAESRRLHLQKRLIEFSLTRAEWEEYRKIHPEVDTASRFFSFEEFYRKAEERDHAMAQNFLKNGYRRNGTSVLVTGGFHSKGINRILSDAGFTVIPFVPKISRIDFAGGTTYLTAFAQEKTPLDRLFEGDRLFLAKNPLGANPESISLLTGSVLTHQDTPSSQVQAVVEAMNPTSSGLQFERIDDAVVARTEQTTVETNFDQRGAIASVAVDPNPSPSIPASLFFHLTLLLGPSVLRIFGIPTDAFNLARNRLVKELALMGAQLEAMAFISLLSSNPAFIGWVIGFLCLDAIVGYGAYTRRKEPLPTTLLNFHVYLALRTVTAVSYAFNPWVGGLVHILGDTWQVSRWPRMVFVSRIYNHIKKVPPTQQTRKNMLNKSFDKIFYGRNISYEERQDMFEDLMKMLPNVPAENLDELELQIIEAIPEFLANPPSVHKSDLKDIDTPNFIFLSAPNKYLFYFRRFFIGRLLFSAFNLDFDRRFKLVDLYTKANFKHQNLERLVRELAKRPTSQLKNHLLALMTATSQNYTRRFLWILLTTAWPGNTAISEEEGFTTFFDTFRTISDTDLSSRLDSVLAFEAWSRNIKLQDNRKEIFDFISNSLPEALEQLTQSAHEEELHEHSFIEKFGPISGIEEAFNLRTHMMVPSAVYSANLEIMKSFLRILAHLAKSNRSEFQQPVVDLWSAYLRNDRIPVTLKSFILVQLQSLDSDLFLREWPPSSNRSIFIPLISEKDSSKLFSMAIDPSNAMDLRLFAALRWSSIPTDTVSFNQLIQSFNEKELETWLAVRENDDERVNRLFKDIVLQHEEASVDALGTWLYLFKKLEESDLENIKIIFSRIKGTHLETDSWDSNSGPTMGGRMYRYISHPGRYYFMILRHELGHNFLNHAWKATPTPPTGRLVPELHISAFQELTCDIFALVKSPMTAEDLSYIKALRNSHSPIDMTQADSHGFYPHQAGRTQLGIVLDALQEAHQPLDPVRWLQATRIVLKRNNINEYSFRELIRAIVYQYSDRGKDIPPPENVFQGLRFDANNFRLLRQAPDVFLKISLLPFRETKNIISHSGVLPASIIDHIFLLIYSLAAGNRIGPADRPRPLPAQWALTVTVPGAVLEAAILIYFLSSIGPGAWIFLFFIADYLFGLTVYRLRGGPLPSNLIELLQSSWRHLVFLFLYAGLPGTAELLFMAYPETLGFLGSALPVLLTVAGFSHIFLDAHAAWKRNERLQKLSRQRFPLLDPEPERKALNIDGAHRRMHKILLRGPAYPQLQDEKPLLKAEDLKGRRQVQHERAQSHLTQILHMMETMEGSELGDPLRSGKEIADRLRQVSIVGVYAGTHLLLSKLFSPLYRWGLIRASRTRSIVFVPMRAFSTLRSREDQQRMAFALAYALRRIDFIASLREQSPALDTHAISEAIKSFEKEQNEREKKFLSVFFRLKHTYWVIEDEVNLVARYLWLRWEFYWLKYKARPVHDEIRGILHDPRYYDGEGGSLNRAKIEQHFPNMREEVHPFYEKLTDLTYRAMEFGNYDMALQITEWGHYIALVDTKMLPMMHLLRTLRVLARAGQYDAMINILESIEAGHLILHVEGTPIPLPIHPRERSFFVTNAERNNFRTWIQKTLTRQAEIMQSRRNRESIMQARDAALALYDRIDSKIMKPVPINPNFKFTPPKSNPTGGLLYSLWEKKSAQSQRFREKYPTLSAYAKAAWRIENAHHLKWAVVWILPFLGIVHVLGGDWRVMLVGANHILWAGFFLHHIVDLSMNNRRPDSGRAPPVNLFWAGLISTFSAILPYLFLRYLPFYNSTLVMAVTISGTLILPFLIHWLVTRSLRESPKPFAPAPKSPFKPKSVAESFDDYLNQLENHILNEGDRNLFPLFNDLMKDLSPSAREVMKNNAQAFNIKMNEPDMLLVYLALSIFILDKNSSFITQRQMDRWESLMKAWTLRLQKSRRQTWWGPLNFVQTWIPGFRTPYFSPTLPHFAKDNWDHLHGYLTVPFLFHLSLSVGYKGKAREGFEALVRNTTHLPPLLRDRVEELNLIILATHLGPNIYPHEKEDFDSAMISFQYGLERLHEAPNANEWALALGTFLGGIAINGDNDVLRAGDMKPFLWDLKDDGDKDWHRFRNTFVGLIKLYPDEIRLAFDTIKDNVQGREDRSWLAQRWNLLSYFFEKLPKWNGEFTLEDLLLGRVAPDHPFIDFLKNWFVRALPESSTTIDEWNKLLIWRNPAAVPKAIKFLEERLPLPPHEPGSGPNTPADPNNWDDGLPLKLSVDDVLGVSVRPSASPAEVKGGEIKMVEINRETSAGPLLKSVLGWLSSPSSETRSAVIYIAPDEKSQGDEAIAQELRQTLAELKGDNDRLTFIFHNQTGRKAFHLENVIAEAFQEEGRGAMGLPRRRLEPYEARLTWARTTDRWSPLVGKVIELGRGHTIPLERIAAYIIDVMEGTARRLSVDVELKGLVESKKST